MPSPKYPQDPDYHPFEYKTATAGFPSWAGVCKQASTAFSQDNQLRAGINIRPVVGGYKCRGGLTKTIATPASAAIDGLFDAGDIGA